MFRLADVMRRHGDDYLAYYGDAVLPSHTRALQAIARCRTGALGGHLALCNDCGRVHLLYHSCGHRACPQCGQDATDRWLDCQRQLLLPVRTSISSSRCPQSCAGWFAATSAS